jgi:hypothetical protein
MAILDTSRYNIYRFWDNEYQHLDYVQEPFNDPDSVALWLSQGYQCKITGDLCDMRHRLPAWTDRFIELYQQRGWQDIGVAFYRMHTGTVMPEHRDLYRRYVEVFNLQGRETTIRRAIVFLEDWKSGHYLELNGHPVVQWQAGDTVEWQYDAPHMAANIGLEPRYTLQITGHM